jgi:hypothetical protein
LDPWRALPRKYRKLLIAAVIVLVYVAVGSYLSRGKVISAPNSYASCRTAGYPFTDSDPPSCSDGARTFVGTYTPPTPTPAAVTSIPFDILVDGDSGGNYPASQQFIHTASAWQSYWSSVHSGLHALPPIIPVDFTQGDVAAISSGPEPTSGYALTVTSVNASATGSVIYATLSVPSVTCKVTYAQSNRYYIIRTPILTPPVTFQVLTTHKSC